MKNKRTSQKLVTSSPTKKEVGGDVRRLKLKQKSLRLLTSSPTKPLPTQLERDTNLTPLWVAESIVQEVERFLRAELPVGWARRLAVRAHYLYRRQRHFQQALQRPGWRGLENLRMFMRHWTAGWLKRARSPLFKQLPESFGLGRALSV